MMTVTELLSRAKDAINFGEASLHAAAEDIFAAQEQGATQRQISEAVGESAAWVNLLLQWHASGCRDDTPFGLQATADHMMRKFVFGLDGLVVQLTGPIILVQFNDMAHILSELEASATQFDEPPPGETRDATHELGPEFGFVLWELGRRLQQQGAALLDDGHASPSQH